MKLKTYKCIGFLIATFFISGLQAQEFDKKFNETFKVNKDVVVAINTSNAAINVTTWNRNEVAVKAVITVEGLSKKEAQKFLNNWEFEALGNKNKVQIKANANRFLHFGDKDFNFDFDFGDFEIPEINFDNFKIEIPDFEMLEIPTPEVPLDFNKIWEEIDKHDFDNSDDAKIFSYQSKGKKKKVVITSKKEWDKFKRSREYDRMKKELRRTIKKATDEIQNIDMKKIHEQINKAKEQYENIDMVQIKESLAAAKKSIEKMKSKMATSYKSGKEVLIIANEISKKKVKITREITIKVPKGAQFDVNTRHSKVNLPKGNVSGKVSYGTFTADGIHGGDVKIYSAPININTLQGSTVSIHNTTDATIASVVNSTLKSNSSNVKIGLVKSNVHVTSEFGALVVSKMIPTIDNFELALSQSEAIIDGEVFVNNLKIDLYTNANEKEYFKKVKKGLQLNGEFALKTKDKNVKVNGKFSTLTLQK